MSTDFMNPSDDLIAGLQAGRGDRQNEIDNLEAENAELKSNIVESNMKGDDLIITNTKLKTINKQMLEALKQILHKATTSSDSNDFADLDGYVDDIFGIAEDAIKAVKEEQDE